MLIRTILPPIFFRFSALFLSNSIRTRHDHSRPRLTTTILIHSRSEPKGEWRTSRSRPELQHALPPLTPAYWDRRGARRDHAVSPLLGDPYSPFTRVASCLKGPHSRAHRCDWWRRSVRAESHALDAGTLILLKESTAEGGSTSTAVLTLSASLLSPSSHSFSASQLITTSSLTPCPPDYTTP